MSAKNKTKPANPQGSETEKLLKRHPSLYLVISCDEVDFTFHAKIGLWVSKPCETVVEALADLDVQLSKKERV